MGWGARVYLLNPYVLQLQSIMTISAGLVAKIGLLVGGLRPAGGCFFSIPDRVHVRVSPRAPGMAVYYTRTLFGSYGPINALVFSGQMKKNILKVLNEAE